MRVVDLKDPRSFNVPYKPEGREFDYRAQRSRTLPIHGMRVVGYDPGFHTWSGQCRAANVKSWSVVSN